MFRITTPYKANWILKKKIRVIRLSVTLSKSLASEP